METVSLRERQLHMTQLLKKLDRLIVEKHGKFNLPFYHYQKPLAAPGERDSVCVYVDAVKREFLPYGLELEKMVEEARLWVRTGEGPRPEVMIEDQAITLAREAGRTSKTGSEAREMTDNEGGEARASGARRKLLSLRQAAADKLTKQRARPPA